ncbi:hypothetical protein TYRP_016986, partial [Tyrophagus putrescentiae]
MYVSGAQIKTARSGVTWLTKNARRRGPRERSERGPSDARRRGLTTLGHCERPPTRVSRAERAGPESVGIHSAQVSSGVPRAKRAGPEETEVDSGQVTSEIRDK